MMGERFRQYNQFVGFTVLDCGSLFVSECGEFSPLWDI
jgi:hypothetical protein